MAEKNTLARPYAEAIYKIAVQNQTEDTWIDTLDILSQLMTMPDIHHFVTNPLTEKTQIISLFETLGKELLDDAGLRLVSLLADYQRFELLPQIKQEFELLKQQAQGIMDVEVISAYAVNTAQKKNIIERLQKRFNKEINLVTRIDKSLIGGIIIRSGDLVIDASVASQLHKISKALTR